MREPRISRHFIYDSRLFENNDRRRQQNTTAAILRNLPSLPETRHDEAALRPFAWLVYATIQGLDDDARFRAFAGSAAGGQAMLMIFHYFRARR